MDKEIVKEMERDAQEKIVMKLRSKTETETKLENNIIKSNIIRTTKSFFLQTLCFLIIFVLLLFFKTTIINASNANKPETKEITQNNTNLSSKIALDSSNSSEQSSIIKVIGHIESLYKDRASLRILEILSPATSSLSIGVGSRISFNLPKTTTSNKKKQSIEYGNIVEVELEGIVTTEYEQSTPNTKTDTQQIQTPEVKIWLAKSIQKVKNIDKYLDMIPDDGTNKTKRKHSRRKNKKESEPLQIWTQEEVVRGKIINSKGKIYLKESRMKPKDLGLLITDSVWTEKLQPYVNKTLVIYGITHRSSISSGTLEVKNILKIYNK